MFTGITARGHAPVTILLIIMSTNHHEVNPQIAISKKSPTPACSSQMSRCATRNQDLRCLASHTEGGEEKRGLKKRNQRKGGATLKILC